MPSDFLSLSDTLTLSPSLSLSLSDTLSLSLSLSLSNTHTHIHTHTHTPRGQSTNTVCTWHGGSFWHKEQWMSCTFGTPVSSSATCNHFSSYLTQAGEVLRKWIQGTRQWWSTTRIHTGPFTVLPRCRERAHWSGSSPTPARGAQGFCARRPPKHRVIWPSARLRSWPLLCPC